MRKAGILTAIMLAIIATSVTVSLHASGQNYSIPTWIKNNAKWWSAGQIGDSDFTQGIQWLIENEIIVIPQGQTSSGTAEKQIPSWIKNNAGWWADGKITDDDFVLGLQYLIQADIIHIETQTLCDLSLWDHVYHPDRLEVIDDCITVTGII